MGMERVSIQDLKGRLSAVVAAAESGRTILITRHNDPVAQLGPATSPHVHRGTQFGAGRISPAITRRTGGRSRDGMRESRGTR